MNDRLTIIERANNQDQLEKECRPLPLERIAEIRKWLHVEGTGTYFAPLPHPLPGIRLFETEAELLAWKVTK